MWITTNPESKTGAHRFVKITIMAQNNNEKLKVDKTEQKLQHSPVMTSHIWELFGAV